MNGSGSCSARSVHDMYIEASLHPLLRPAPLPSMIYHHLRFAHPPSALTYFTFGWGSFLFLSVIYVLSLYSCLFSSGLYCIFSFCSPYNLNYLYIRNEVFKGPPFPPESSGQGRRWLYQLPPLCASRRPYVPIRACLAHEALVALNQIYVILIIRVPIHHRIRRRCRN